MPGFEVKTHAKYPQEGFRYRECDLILKAGIRLLAPQIAILASLGKSTVLVDIKPNIGRVNLSENLERIYIYLAGADFALSVSQVSGQILTQKWLGDDSITIYSDLKLCDKIANLKLYT